MMTFSFCLLLISYIVFIYLLFRFDAWNQPESLLALFFVTTFVAPGAYFAWVEGSYTVSSMVLLNALGTYTIVLSGGALFVCNRLMRKADAILSKKKTGSKAFPQYTWQLWYVVGLSAMVLIWLAVNLQALPILGWFTGKEIGRPDSVPTIKHFYSFSTLLYFILPSFYLLFADKWGRIQAGLLMLVAILLASGGHKGVLAFFFIFLWWFKWGKSFNWKALVAGGISMVVYALNIMVTTGKVNGVVETIELSLKRFFVEQARGLPVRFDMVSDGFNFAEEESIKHQVARYEWPGSTGSMPTSMFGDVYVNYGLPAALLCILVLVVSIFGGLYAFRAVRNSIVLKWSVLVFLFLAFGTELSFYSAFRYLAVGANLLILTAGSFNLLEKNEFELR